MQTTEEELVLNGAGGEWKPAPPDTKYPPQPKDTKAGVVKAGVVMNKTDMLVPATGGDCDSNNCSNLPPHNGCAICATVIVRLPLTANVVAVRFYSTANFSQQNHADFPTPRLMVPGEDRGWSHYDGWGQNSSGATKIVYAAYHNRSSDRVRNVSLEVDYTV